MDAYLTVMFWSSVLSVFCYSLRLLSEHPRIQAPVSTGQDAFNLIQAIALLAWVAFLKYGA